MFQCAFLSLELTCYKNVYFDMSVFKIKHYICSYLKSAKVILIDKNYEYFRNQKTNYSIYELWR